MAHPPSASEPHVAPFEQRLAEALASPSMEKALTRALPAFRERRLAAFADDDFSALQQDFARRKAAAIGRLPELIERFRREAEAVGAQVYLAKTPTDARQIVGRIARERGAKLVVKGKSMASEEVGINEHLEAQGVRVVETDLGEWIIQLAHEKPTHLLAPAIHKTREEVAELFSRYTGQALPPEIEQLVQVARRELRQAFVDADLGITGTNAAIAETGTLVLLENEGNGRLSSGLPPVHVAMLGVEKLLPSLDDVTAMLRLLARSATGQRASSYVSFITGPSRTADIELSLTIGVHGPKELHIVLIDNGRLALREDPDLHEALHCIRCGACANVCPPFQVVSGKAFGYIYTGPIGLMLTAAHHGLEHAAGPQTLCASCNACETVCPAGIPLPRQIIDVRTRVVEAKGLPRAKKLAFGTLADPAKFERRLKLARLAQKPLARNGFIRKGPLVNRVAEWRSLPALPKQSLRRKLAPGKKRDEGVVTLAAPGAPTIAGSQAAGVTVAYFANCFTDHVYPEMGEAIVKVLAACGATVVFPLAQHCCGLPALNSGDRVHGRQMAEQTIAALENVPGDYILSGATSCVVAIAQDYLHLFRDDLAWLARAEALSRRLIDFTHFMSDVARLPAGALCGPHPPAPSPLAMGEGRGEGLPGREAVTYHDSCQSYNSLGLRTEPRRLITEVLGLELREMAESQVCCGFGGSFSLEQPEVAARVLARKLQHAMDTGAPTIVADNPGCLLQLRGGVDARQRPIRVLHLAELIAERLPGGGVRA